MFLKFRAVVGLDVFNLAISQVKQTIEKIGRVVGIGPPLHAGEGHFGKRINTGKDVSFQIVHS